MIKNKKIYITIAIFFFLISISILSLFCVNNSLFAWAEENPIENTSSETELNLGYIEIFAQDGTIQKMPKSVFTENDIDNQESARGAKPAFTEHKILDSGKPDSESLVMTIMGDGFTASQQADFLSAATFSIDKLLGNP